MSFEIYRYLFCILVGIAWGISHFTYKSLTTGCAGAAGAVVDRNDGGIKIASFYNLSLISFFWVFVFLWFSGQEDSLIFAMVWNSWAYFTG